MAASSYGPGDVLGERYVLKKTEWSSPLGPVWLARDRVLDRAVLVQLLAPQNELDPRAATAFQKAAARIAQASHPGLLQVYDIGTDPAFAVLEHAAGGRLAERLRAGPMRHTEAARSALALARGIEALHERGAWHGSLSPASVLFDEEGRAKIMAAGAAETARAGTGVDARAEQPPGYRTPEADPIPADADRYALAALTYHMLTGRAPEPGMRVRQLRRNVPQAIDDLLVRALSPDPARRPSLDEFVGALAPYARVEPPEARGPRFRTSEFRWLLPVVLIVALAAVAATVGVQVVKELGERDAGGQPTTPTPTAEALRVQSVDDFDPPPGNGEETPQKVNLTIDGDPRTAWTTVGYVSEELGGGKKGVGLLFDLGRGSQLRRIRVQSTLPGWRADIRIADATGDRADDFRLVTTFVAATDTQVPLPAGTTGRYVLLWIIRLGEDEGNPAYPFRAAVAEVEFFAG